MSTTLEFSFSGGSPFFRARRDFGGERFFLARPPFSYWSLFHERFFVCLSAKSAGLSLIDGNLIFLNLLGSL